MLGTPCSWAPQAHDLESSIPNAHEAEVQDSERLSTQASAEEQFLADVVQSLSTEPKWLPAKYFYDAHGSELFDRICELPEYYVTRTEVSILEQFASEIAQEVGPNAAVIELGSGSSLKTSLLLRALDSPAGYVPIDISGEHLATAADRIAQQFPDLKVVPVAADFNRPIQLPNLGGRRRLAYFPGSTIGNFTPGSAVNFLRRVASICGPSGALLIGVDLRKDPAILERAYDDSQGVTAAFNLNVLRHINRELGADFDLEAFEHLAIFNDVNSRVEMHLVSKKDQSVRLGDRTFQFQKGERISTEYSHKFTLEAFATIAGQAGFEVTKVWMDEQRLFSVQFLTIATS